MGEKLKEKAVSDQPSQLCKLKKKKKKFNNSPASQEIFLFSCLNLKSSHTHIQGAWLGTVCEREGVLAFLGSAGPHCPVVQPGGVFKLGKPMCPQPSKAPRTSVQLGIMQRLVICFLGRGLRFYVSNKLPRGGRSKHHTFVRQDPEALMIPPGPSICRGVAGC